MESGKPAWRWALHPGCVRRGKEDRLAIAPAELDPQQRDPALVTLVLKALDARRLLLGEGSAGLIDAGFHQRYLERLARLRFLVPDIISAHSQGPAAQGAHRTQAFTGAQSSDQLERAAAPSRVHLSSLIGVPINTPVRSGSDG